MTEEPRWRRYDRLLGRNPRTDTESELSFHLEMRVRDYMRRGMSEAEARAAATARLGDTNAVRAECDVIGAADVRGQRRREWFAELRQDIRYGARQLWRAPTFTVVAVLILALGIGATTAIYSLVNAVLLAPLPYAEPDRLVRVWETSPQGDQRNVVSQGNLVDWTQRARSFSALGAFRQPYTVALTGEGDALRVTLTDMQPAVARALAVRPVLGRTVIDSDARDAGDVVVLSHGFWQQRYGGDRGVLGRRVMLNDVPHTIVGVLPPQFAYPRADVQLWRPLRDADLDPTQRRSHVLHVIGRLAPNATLASAQAEMATIAANLAAEHPQFMSGWGVNVVRVHRDLTEHVRPLFTVLLGAVAVVLLIACGNLANLLLTRAVGREREIAVRSALGAGRGRIARQLLTESLLLALAGGAAALALAPLLLDLLIQVAPPNVPLLERAAIDRDMWGFAAIMALGCALLFGLAPAVRLLRSDVQLVLRGGRAVSPHNRMREALLVAQVALSVLLLVGAGLFVRSFAALNATELGFDETGIVTMEADLPRPRYPETPQQIAFHEQLLERVRALPGVVRAAGTSEPPGGGYEMTFSFGIEGRVAQNPSGREDPEQLRAITPGYFDVLGQRVVRGRAFDARDRAAAAPVAIINESLARKHWPNADPLGARIAFQPGETAWLEIVGVVADVRLASPDLEPVPALYIPYAQKTWPWLTWQTIMARTTPDTDAAAMQNTLRTVLLELDPALPPSLLGTVEDAFRENLARRRFALTLVTGFGAVALLLSIVGVYGLLAYSVSQQTREIGVRLAIGARAPKIVRAVMARAMILAALGAGGGLIAAAAASSVVESLLYQVAPIDATTYAATAVIVLLVALAAAALPAWRAAHVSPLQALRSD